MGGREGLCGHVAGLPGCMGFLTWGVQHPTSCNLVAPVAPHGVGPSLRRTCRHPMRLRMQRMWGPLRSVASQFLWNTEYSAAEVHSDFCAIHTAQTIKVAIYYRTHTRSTPAHTELVPVPYPCLYRVTIQPAHEVCQSPSQCTYPCCPHKKGGHIPQ